MMHFYEGFYGGFLLDKIMCTSIVHPFRIFYMIDNDTATTKVSLLTVKLTLLGDVDKIGILRFLHLDFYYRLVMG